MSEGLYYGYRGGFNVVENPVLATQGSLQFEYLNVAQKWYPRYIDFVTSATCSGTLDSGQLKPSKNVLKVILHQKSRDGKPLKSIGSVGNTGFLFIKDSHYDAAKNILGSYGRFFEGNCFVKETRVNKPIYLYVPDLLVDAIDYDHSKLTVSKMFPKGDGRHVRTITKPVFKNKVVENLEVFKYHPPFNPYAASSPCFSQNMIDQLIEANILAYPLLDKIEAI